MSIVSRLFGGDEAAPARRQNAATTDYIDLSDYAATEKPGEAGAHTQIRFAELKALDDLKHYASYLYDGNILVLDFRPAQQDEVLLRRLTNELRKIAQDTGGDIAGLGDSYVIITPSGVKVDRRKLERPKEEAQAPPPVRSGPVRR